MSAAQVLDWLLERYEELKVAESTVRNYVRELRKEYNIPKESTPRSYEAVPEKPMGEQIQVDFGQTTQITPDGRWEKLRFIAFVLANSRYKYMEWLDRPFTTQDVIRCHENAFNFYGGIPNELVYDQDALILVSENSGDLILTQKFQAYKEERQLNLHICRRADPESKGKIENVVKYIKHNFAKHRVYHGLDKWNEESLKWLERTGNYKEHNSTKKRPVEVFSLERLHLRPISSPIEGIFDPKITSSITRSVRKDNTIWFQSNRYSVPLGTFNKIKSVSIEQMDHNYLAIIDSETGELLAKHPIHPGKGQLIQDTNHLRDRTLGIDAQIESLAARFMFKDSAIDYFESIREGKPRYIRDQLQIIKKHTEGVDPVILDQSLETCIKSNLYSATDFIDIVQHMNRQRDGVAESIIPPFPEACPLDDRVSQTSVYKRDIQEYLSVLEGVGKHE